MTFWLAALLLTLAVAAGLFLAVRRAGGRGTIGLIAALIVPGIALAIYATTGAPELPDQPHATRGDVAARAEMDTLLNELAQRLERDPTRLDGWLLLARSRLKIGDTKGAVETFARARLLVPNDGDIASETAEAMIHAENGTVSADARAALNLARSKNPRDAKALFYLGHDELAQGHYAAAIQHWRNLIAVSPPDAPWIADINARIAAAATEGNVDLSSIQPTVAPEAPTMPDREQIRAMVEGLAARMAETPDDLAGWRMLARSWRVLGESAKADEADAWVKGLEAK